MTSLEAHMPLCLMGWLIDVGRNGNALGVGHATRSKLGKPDSQPITTAFPSLEAGGECKGFSSAEVTLG